MSRIILFLATLLIYISSFAQLPKYITDMYPKQKYVKESRWTIADWFETKQKIDLMDQWLAMNRSANIFELKLSAGLGKHDDTNTASLSDLEGDDLKQYQVSAFLTIFGLEAALQELADGSELKRAFFKVRLLGTSEQSSNIIIKYGQQQWLDMGLGEDLKNTVWGGQLTLYLFDFFGLTASYESIMDETTGAIGLKGARSEYGGFLELGFVRLLGTWFTEPLDVTQSGTTTSLERRGVTVALQLFL